MKKLALSLMAAMAVAGFATSASALTVNVTYAISSTIAIPGIAPVAGPPGSGTLTVQYLNGTIGGHIGAGPVHLLSFSLAQSIDFFYTPVAGFPLHFTGLANASVPGSAPGTVLPVLGSVGSIFLGPAIGSVTGFIHCNGPTFLCSSSLINLPASVPQPISLSIPFGISGGVMAGLSVASGGGINWSGTFLTFASQPVIGTFTGTEVSRNVVPEPNTLALVGFGVLGLASLARRIKRR